MTRRLFSSIAVLLVALLGGGGGCASQQYAREVELAVQDYFAGDYARAAETLRPLAARPDENFVLNNLRLGSVLLSAYDLDGAEAAFLRAWEVINSTGVNDGGRTLGAVLVDEKIRIWKGEPFERAMASFYLGLVYYLRQDYANARGAFENALFKLRDVDPATEAGREVDSNFALASLMLARSFQRLGREDLARANFEQVAKTDPHLAALADYERSARANVLLVVDYGYGPHKATDFDGAIVGFAPTPWEEGPIPHPIVRVDGRPTGIVDIAQPPVDLLAMAQDRKWQSIDTIRTVKSALGTGLMVGGAVTGLDAAYNRHGDRQRDNLIVAGALIGTGLLLKATSQADVRQWEMLPRTTFVLPLTIEPGTREITVEFPERYGTVTQTWRNVPVPSSASGGETTLYLRMMRWNSGPFDWAQAPTGQGAGDSVWLAR